MDRGGDVPPALDHPRVGVHRADIRGGEFLPPQPPWIDQHVGLAVGLPGDVTGHVLCEPDAREVAEGNGERLRIG